MNKSVPRILSGSASCIVKYILYKLNKTKHKNLFSALFPASQALVGNIEKKEINLSGYLHFMAYTDMYFSLKLCMYGANAEWTHFLEDSKIIARISRWVQRQIDVLVPERWSKGI